ncbi:hypothetical protein [Paraburkholderia fungorum]|uniref:hypothetical protein n=1 Tax=Paraburkholderia fungorum TaxID=134537 RepID=UPI0016076155|nr:hypothetical protein [Paraburkholderia fungorum]MBB5543577.1 hypothetical protein [Paraburkholderia fungorum]
MSDAKIIARSLLKQAEQIAEAGHAGWGNLDRDAADLIEQQATRIAELEQELRNIANADTVEWDDPTQFEAWAKSRARHTLGAQSASGG